MKRAEELLSRWGAWPGAVVFAAGLALFAWAGGFTRYWADDFCYTSGARLTTFVDGSVWWWRTNGNRLAALWFVEWSEVFGPRAIQWLPGAALALWALAAGLALTRLWGRKAGAWAAFLGLGLAFYAALLAPDRPQTVYWRMGMLHYSLPIPLFLLWLSAALGDLRPAWRKTDALWAAGSIAWAALAALLSETFAALQVGLLGLALLAGWFGLARGARERFALRCAAGLLGTLAAMAVMATAPANAWRQAVMPPPDNLLWVLPYSARYALDFIWFSLRGQPLPTLGWLAAAGAAGYFAGFKLTPRRWAWAAPLAAAATLALVMCVAAPSVYAGLSYPNDRAWAPARFVMLAGLAVEAFCAAGLLRWAAARWKRPAWAALLAGLALLLALAYPLKAFDAPLRDAAALAGRAARWDERDERIRALRDAGEREITVRQTDIVQGLEDLGEDPTAWVNRCAAEYYGVDAIIATP